MDRTLIPDTSTPIFALQLTPTALRHRAVSVARSAGRQGIAVHAVHSSRLAPAALSRYVCGGLIVPRRARPEEWVDNLLRVGRKLGRAVLVPQDDAAAVLVDEHAGALAEHYLFPRRPADVSRRLSDKRRLHGLCHELGIPTPASLFPAGAAEAARDARELGYPVVLKRIRAWGSGIDVQAPSVHVARDEAGLRAAYALMQSPDAGNVMLQQYVPGGPDSIWMFNGYFDARSEPLVAFTGRKLRQYPPYTGSTSLGVCERSERVVGCVRRLLRAVGYRGIVDLGFRHDARDDSLRLLDVNPRIGDTFRLFVGDNGLDVLHALYLDMTGQPVPETHLRDGRRWILEPQDLWASTVYMRDGLLSPRAWVRSLNGIDEAAWIAADDPLPAVAIPVPFAARAVRDAFARATSGRAVRD